MTIPIRTGISLSRQRTPVIASSDSLVRVSQLNSRGLPQVVEPILKGVGLIQWCQTHAQELDSMLNKAGAVLFRNFGIATVEQFRAAIEAACGPLLEYKERSSPRTEVKGNVFTSTDYPADRSIFLHTEQSYNYTFPLRIAFFCMTEPGKGGETPIADTRRVLKRIRPQTRSRFEDKGYLYVRNFGGGAGLSWQEAFQTEDPQEVERHCRANFIDFEWVMEDRLRTRQLRPVIANHPGGDKAWFNHLTFFHVSTLEPDIREQMLETFREEDLPNNTYYNDGRRIEPEVIDELRAAYLEEAIAIPWKAGDLLLLDNVLTAHGRAPFTPPRTVVVTMARPLTWPEVSPLI
jgi:alpha-ketoglutarate-dependent taurine dioxygenase